jgi:hypothetical protein
MFFFHFVHLVHLYSQCVQVHVVPADDPGQELVVGDVLHDGGQDPARFLVQDFVVPMRIYSLKEINIFHFSSRVATRVFSVSLQFVTLS